MRALPFLSLLACSAPFVGGQKLGPTESPDPGEVGGGWASGDDTDLDPNGEGGGDGSPPVDTGPFDRDGDGVVAAADCNDADPATYPGAAEVCDGVDTNCDGTADPASPPSCPDPAALGLSEGAGLLGLDAAGYVLRDEDLWLAYDAIIAALAARLGTVSVGDVLADANRDGVVIDSGDLPRATGFQRGFGWNSGDNDVDYWFPQGVTGTFDADPSGQVDGYEAVLVSWHHEPDAEGVSYDKGVRVAFADISHTDAVPYRLSLLVEPTGSASSPSFQAVKVHAGGIAWVGDLLYVADTSAGLRVFDMGRIMQVATDRSDLIGCDSAGVCRAYNYKYVIPQIGRYSLPACGCDATFSFVGLDRSSDPPSLVTGEYDSDAISGVLRRWPLDPSTLLLGGGLYTAASEAYVAQQDRMQGAASDGGRWWLSCSSQSGAYGKVYAAVAGSSTGYTWVDGPEDLAVDPNRRHLWSATEDVGDRWVFSAAMSALGG